MLNKILPGNKATKMKGAVSQTSNLKFWYSPFSGAGDRGRTDTVSLPPDFESGTSANSITPADAKWLYNIHQNKSIETKWILFQTFTKHLLFFVD